jgi:hypothetical protein
MDAFAFLEKTLGNFSQNSSQMQFSTLSADLRAA